jgi:hypothetical protein
MRGSRRGGWRAGMPKYPDPEQALCTHQDPVHRVVTRAGSLAQAILRYYTDEGNRARMVKAALARGGSGKRRVWWHSGYWGEGLETGRSE